jgi:hypothetical protein
MSMFKILDWQTNNIEIPIADAYSWVRDRGLLADIIRQEQVTADTAHRTTAIVVYQDKTKVVEQVIMIKGKGANTWLSI